jgi:tetratricopeptide (TPR) repeat protein
MTRFLAAALFAAPFTYAQGPAAGSNLLRDANAGDLQGNYQEARGLYRMAFAQAATPAAKSAVLRQIAMSYAFEGDCKNTANYEDQAAAYFRDNPDAPDRFYQQGELADEAARVCIDAGDLDTAEVYYAKGRDAGLKQPDIPPDRVKLWNFRYEHRRGNKAEAEKHVAIARQLVDGMTELKAQQQPFLPYLTGYVAFYAGDYKKALEDFQKAQQNDAFIQCMIGESYEKLGDKEKAMQYYRQAAAVQGHNPPAAYARRFTRQKLS